MERRFNSLAAADDHHCVGAHFHHPHVAFNIEGGAWGGLSLFLPLSLANAIFEREPHQSGQWLLFFSPALLIIQKRPEKKKSLYERTGCENRGSRGGRVEGESVWLCSHLYFQCRCYSASLCPPHPRSSSSGCPYDLDFREVRDGSLVLLWAPPLYQGRGPVTGYVLEMSQGDQSEDWSAVHEKAISGTHHKVSAAQHRGSTGGRHSVRVFL